MYEPSSPISEQESSQEKILWLLSVTPLSPLKLVEIFEADYDNYYLPSKMYKVIFKIFQEIHALNIEPPRRKEGARAKKYQSVLDFSLDSNALLPADLLEDLLREDDLENQEIDMIAYILEQYGKRYIARTQSPRLKALSEQIYAHQHQKKLAILLYWLDALWSTNEAEVGDHIAKAYLDENETIQILNHFADHASQQWDITFRLFCRLENGTQQKADLLFKLFTGLNNDADGTNRMHELLAEEPLKGTHYQTYRKKFFYQYAKTKLPFYYQESKAMYFYDELVRGNRIELNDQWDIMRTWLKRDIKERELENILQTSHLMTPERRPLLIGMLEKLSARYIDSFQSSQLLAKHIEYYLKYFNAEGLTERPSTLTFLKALATLPTDAFSGYAFQTTAKAWLNIQQSGEKNKLNADMLGLLLGSLNYFTQHNDILSETTLQQLYTLIATIVVPLIEKPEDLSFVLLSAVGTIPTKTLARDSSEWSKRLAQENMVQDLLTHLVSEASYYFQENEDATILLPYLDVIPKTPDYLITTSYGIKSWYKTHVNILLQIPVRETIAKNADRLNRQLGIIDALLDFIGSATGKGREYDEWQDYSSELQHLLDPYITHEDNDIRQQAPYDIPDPMSTTDSKGREYSEGQNYSSAYQHRSGPYSTPQYDHERQLAIKNTPDFVSTAGKGQDYSMRLSESQRNLYPDNASQYEQQIVVAGRRASWLELIIPVITMKRAMRRTGTIHIVQVWKHYGPLFIENQEIFMPKEWRRIQLARDFFVAHQQALTAPDDIHAQRQLIQAYQSIQQDRSSAPQLTDKEREDAEGISNPQRSVRQEPPTQTLLITAKSVSSTFFLSRLWHKLFHIPKK